MLMLRMGCTRHARLGLLMSLTASASFSGCGDDKKEATDEVADAGGGDEDAGNPFEDCSSVMNTCLGDPECLALYSCLSDCGSNDLICQKGCYMANGGAVEELQAVLDCSATKCPGPCGQ